MMLPLNWMSSACLLPFQNKPNRPLVIRCWDAHRTLRGGVVGVDMAAHPMVVRVEFTVSIRLLRMVSMEEPLMTTMLKGSRIPCAAVPGVRT